MAYTFDNLLNMEIVIYRCTVYNMALTWNVANKYVPQIATPKNRLGNIKNNWIDYSLKYIKHEYEQFLVV